MSTLLISIIFYRNIRSLTDEIFVLMEASVSGNKWPSVVKINSSNSKINSPGSANNKNKYLNVSDNTKLSIVSSCLLVLTSDTAA